jgi:hypothetical protein
MKLPESNGINEVLALPAGYIGEIADCRKLILRTEIWMLIVASVLAEVMIARMITPWLLLLHHQEQVRFLVTARPAAWR